MLHDLSHLPVVADPSHATGYTRYVAPMALAAAAAGADGLEIEVHDAPEPRLVGRRAGAHPRAMFDELMERIRVIRGAIAPAGAVTGSTEA